MSKFSTLPDIDLTSVDVYETASSPELTPAKGRSRGAAGTARSRDSDVTSDEDDGEGSGIGKGSPSQRRRRREKKAEEQDGRGSIDREGIKTDEARERFEGSTQVKRGGPSSSVRARRKQGGTSFLDSDIYELESPVNRASETPLAKLRRLRLEVEELEQQLADQTADRTTGPVKGAAERPHEPTPEVLLTQIRALRLALGDMQADRQDEAEVQVGSVAQARGLLESLQNDQARQQGSRGTGANDEPGRGGVEAISTSKVNEARGLADIEERLTLLESLVGSNQSILEETQSLPRPLLPSLSRLEHLSTLLSQPRHIDATSKRIKVLVSELDRVYESRKKLAAIATSSTVGSLHDNKMDTSNKRQSAEGDQGVNSDSPLDPITLSKLDDLFALSSRIQPLLPLAPGLLARLRSLSVLHSSASEFSSSLDTLQASQSEVKNSQEELKTTLSSLEESMKDNDERVKGNLDVVMKRLEALDQRVRRL